MVAYQKMEQKIEIDKKSFDQIEKNVLKEVMNISKSILETFKFNMIYSLKIKPSSTNKTLIALKEFREKNWDNRLDRNKAYKKYLSLY